MRSHAANDKWAVNEEFGSVFCASTYKNDVMATIVEANVDCRVDSSKWFSCDEGFGARLTHLHAGTQYSSGLDSYVNVQG
jgi:hypothetical protein